MSQRTHNPISNEAYFDALFHKHQRTLYAYLFAHLSQKEVALDLLQETFLRVWRHIEEARQIPIERQTYWLFAIARNQVLDFRRRQSTRTQGESILLEGVSITAKEGNPEEALLNKERRDTIDSAIANLPEDLRLVLALHLMGEMTSEEIGQSLQRPAGTVRYQLSKARKRLTEALNEEKNARE
jgi:RNA polymerase sigma-70 factor (ECF subfamily)